jgi:hypothetical protein
MSDDYRIITMAQLKFPEWNFYTIEDPNAKGKDARGFKVLPADIKYEEYLRLFANIDICIGAKKFIGTFTSNVGMFVGMRCGNAIAIVLTLILGNYGEKISANYLGL